MTQPSDPLWSYGPNLPPICFILPTHWPNLRQFALRLKSAATETSALSFLLAASFIASPVLGVQSFTIINPYKGTDSAGPYPQWYGTSAHTHTLATGSTGTVPQLFTDGAAHNLILIPVNDKNLVSPDPGSHQGQYYWPGYEETVSAQHILCLGCTTWPGARTSNQDAVNKMHAQGGLSIIAHPNFGNYWQPADVPVLAGFDGVEVVNGQGFIGWNVWDAALGLGRQVIGTAGNDLYSAGYAEVMFINSPTNSMADLLANFKLGNFYGADVCTNGVGGCTLGHSYALRVTQSGNTVTANFQYSETDSTPQNPASVTWLCGYPTAGSTCGTGASYTITGNEVYVRAVWGNPNFGPFRAWSQPIYVVPTVNGVPPPVITSAITASATVASSFSYAITATNSPTSFGASGLPAGLTLNSTTGVISGAPQFQGSFTIILSATNAAGTRINPLAFNIALNAGGRMNVALKANGATAVASSEFANLHYPASSAITGNQSGSGWGSDSGGWADGTPGVYPDSLEVDFANTRNIQEVDVYTVQDAYTFPSTPAAGMTFSQYGITDFEVQYFTGSAWVDVPGGHIIGNNLVWRPFTFVPIATAKIRILVNNSPASYSRIVGVEAYESTQSATPIIIGPTNATGTVGSAFTYAVTATNSPTSFNATGLPAGLSVNTATGLISGIPQNTGTSNVTLSATNSSGTGTSLLTLTITSPPSASAVYVKLDGTTSGNWKGVYGADGFTINSDASSIPAYAQVSFSSNTLNYTWAYPTTATRALQQGTASGRIASTWYDSSFRIDLNLTDGTTHQIALYVVDWENINRAETIDVRDYGTGVLLNNLSLANYTNGQYPVWNIKGHVTFTITNTNPAQGQNAIVSAVFFGPGMVAPVITSPTSATGTVGSAFTYTITATNSPTSFNATGLPAGLSVNTATGLISGIPQNTGTSNVTLSATNSSGTGTSLLTLTITSPPSASAVYVKLDGTTSGNWKGVYGADGFTINSDASSIPAYAQVSFSSNTSNYTWAYPTTATRALQQGTASGRIASTWYDSSFRIDLNLTDGTTHQIALYVVDWENINRAETIDVRDYGTGVLLNNLSLANYTNGQYPVWNIKGHVTFTITNTNPAQGQNAIVSAVFFGQGSGTPLPDFTVDATPPSQSIVGGSSAGYTVTIGALQGFAASVGFSVTGLPVGVTVAFSPTTVTGSGTSALTLTTTAATAPGTYPLTLTATSGSLSHAANISLTVTAPPDFTVGATPPSQSIVAGSNTGYTVTIGALNGFAASVGFSVAGLPVGVTAAFSPTTVTGSGTSALTLTTTAAAAPGSYPLTLTATGGSLSHAANISLTVTTPPGFTVGATPPSQSIVAGSNAGYTVTIGALNGFAASVGFSVTGLPVGVTAAFSPTTVAGSGTAALTLTTTAAAAPGTYPLSLTATSGSLTHTANISLTVTILSGGGSLSGAMATPSGPVQLTTEGSSDWAHWGLTVAGDFNHKAAVTQQINYSNIGNALRYANNSVGFTWTDGTPTATATNSTTGIYVNGINNGFRVTAPADGSLRTLKVYVGAFRTQGQLTAHLSDGSAIDYTDSSLSNSAPPTSLAVYTFTYRAATSGQILTVTYTNKTANGNVTLQAATLR